MRLNKFIAQTGIASRRQAEEIIAQGRVQINGQVTVNPAANIEPERDKVTVDGKIVAPQPKIYLMLNKPANYTSTCRKFKGERSILDLVQLPHRLYPVGRLDKDTAGLILLTNDGDMALRLSHPRYEQEKEYMVEIDRALPRQAWLQLTAGVDIGEGQPEIVKAKRLIPVGGKSFRLVLTQGKKRQIRRMLAALGANVTGLARTRIKGLTLGNLPEGGWRYLTPEEVRNLTDTPK